MRLAFFVSLFFATQLCASDQVEQTPISLHEHIFGLDALRGWLLERGVTVPLTEIAGKLIVGNVGQYAANHGAALCTPLSPELAVVFRVLGIAVKTICYVNAAKLHEQFTSHVIDNDNLGPLGALSCCTSHSSVEMIAHALTMIKSDKDDLFPLVALGVAESISLRKMFKKYISRCQEEGRPQRMLAVATSGLCQILSMASLLMVGHFLWSILP